jgi:hypothetical protein
MTIFLLLWVAWQPIWVSGLGYENRNPPVGLLTKTLTRPWAGFLAGTHGLGRALASSTPITISKFLDDRFFSRNPKRHSLLS